MEVNVAVGCCVSHSRSSVFKHANLFVLNYDRVRGTQQVCGLCCNTASHCAFIALQC